MTPSPQAVERLAKTIANELWSEHHPLDVKTVYAVARHVLTHFIEKVRVNENCTCDPYDAEGATACDYCLTKMELKRLKERVAQLVSEMESIVSFFKEDRDGMLITFKQYERIKASLATFSRQGGEGK